MMTEAAVPEVEAITTARRLLRSNSALIPRRRRALDSVNWESRRLGGLRVHRRPSGRRLQVARSHLHLPLHM